MTFLWRPSGAIGIPPLWGYYDGAPLGLLYFGLYSERSRVTISDLLSLIFRNLNSSKTYDTTNP